MQWFSLVSRVHFGSWPADPVIRITKLVPFHRPEIAGDSPYIQCVPAGDPRGCQGHPLNTLLDGYTLCGSRTGIGGQLRPSNQQENLKTFKTPCASVMYWLFFYPETTVYNMSKSKWGRCFFFTTKH